MNRKLLILSISILVLNGCSEKNTQLTPSISSEVSYGQNHSIASKFEEATSLQKQRDYVGAIEIYNSIINYYKGQEDKGILLSAYINKFECTLISNQNYRQEDVEDFLRRFGNDKKALMEFELLYILDTAKTKSMDSKIEQWASRYRGEHLTGWTFMYIDDWIQRIENPTIRYRLNRYVSIFKKFL